MDKLQLQCKMADGLVVRSKVQRLNDARDVTAQAWRKSSMAQAPIAIDFKPGAIKRLVAKNFMCHELLEMPFSPRVNIITGVNGSGKSAVLQAIVLGLGINVARVKPHVR